MAVKVKPAAKKVNPIQGPTSRGVVDDGAKKLFDHRNKTKIQRGKDTAPTGAVLGDKVSGATSISGASV